MRFRVVGLAMAFFVWASSLQATPVTDPRVLSPDQKAAVERLANEGATLFQQGDFASALKKFELAEEIVRIPTITLERGRSLERLGRWVDASTAYEAAATAEVLATASFQHSIARQDAAKALADIAPRIPKLKVTVKNAKTAEIFVDGRSMGAPKSDPLLVDPGKHVLEARGAAGAHATKTVDLTAGASETVELELVSTRDPGSQAGSGPTLSSVLGWTAVGTGGALLVVSLGTGISAIMAQSDLAARCPGNRCTEEAWSDVDRYDALRWTAGVSLFAGAIIAGGGVALVLLDPESASEPATKQASVEPLLGPGFVGVRGSFP
jgi:hypothetical protein